MDKSAMVADSMTDQQRAKADYFGMLADMGMKKHLGSLTVYIGQKPIQIHQRCCAANVRST
jgi:hypothetical protein